MRMIAANNLTGDGIQMKNTRRTSMLSHFNKWITTTINSSRSAKYISLPHCNSWEFSNPSYPLQRIFASSAVETLVPLSGDYRSVGWSCYPSSQCYVSDFLNLQTMESLSIRKKCLLPITLCTVWSIFDDNDDHKR